VGAALSRTAPRGTKATAAPRLDRDELRDFGTRLRRWYRRNARDLPWRRTRDPYHILVSELMLQQTQVSRVLGFWRRFLERFPTLHHLAGAREAQVLEAWAGLGYYARARNLHKLSRAVVREGPRAWGDLAVRHAASDGAHTPNVTGGGTLSDSRARPRPLLPSEPEQLRRLPGIGAYTAGAVATFAFERRAALVDTNVARVLTRVFAPRLHPKRARDQKAIWAIAEATLPRTGKASWTHNQALMELGALVCTARVKRCAKCPLRGICRSVETDEA
jgi:A/G-specific adenine glycosylase